MPDDTRCVCGATMRMVPVHHKQPRRTTHWPVCPSCYPGVPVREVQVLGEPVPPTLTVVRTSA